MKTEVLKYLQSKEGTPEERYNAGMALLRKSEGKSIPAVNYYNRAGFTKENLKNICYDLQKLHGISDMEVLAKGSKKSEVRSEKLEGGNGKLEGENSIDGATKDISDAEETDTDIPKNDTDVAKNDTDVAENGTDVPKNATVGVVGDKLGFITDAKRSLAIDEAPADAKAGLKLIEEFPFLDDADCPDSLKILVQDKFTAWRKYLAAHKGLFVVVENVDGEDVAKEMTNTELFSLATEALENFELNRAIWDELNYYKEHKEILGNHPIFADEKLKEKVASMKGTELVKRRNNVRSYITKETKKLKPDTEEEAAKKIKAKIKGYNQELQLLEARIESEK